MPDIETFEFAFEPRFRGLLRVIGVTPDTTLVTVTEDAFRVRFGGWTLETPLANCTGTCITEDYRWYRAIGARGSFKDKGVTFGTSTERGVCVRFAEPVPALVPGNLLKHPGATVTVADCDGLVAALTRRAVPVLTTGVAAGGSKAEGVGLVVGDGEEAVGAGGDGVEGP